MKTPRTLQDAIVYFSDPQRAFDYAVSLRWPGGNVRCPRCNSDKHYFIKTRRLWLCRGCDKQFTVKVGTIFEDSALGLDKWMTAFWMLVNCKNGVSSMEIHRAIGVTQKSAWFMLQRLRTALHNRSIGFTRKKGVPGTELEADETFIGGLTKNMHKERKARLYGQGGFHGGKTVVQGIFDREVRQVRAHVVPDVEPFHLTRYIDEQVFRFNNRATKGNPLNDSDRFALAMSQVAGRRLTYADLTGKNESPRHVPTGTGETPQVPF